MEVSVHGEVVRLTHDVRTASRQSSLYDVDTEPSFSVWVLLSL